MLSTFLLSRFLDLGFSSPHSDGGPEVIPFSFAILKIDWMAVIFFLFQIEYIYMCNNQSYNKYIWKEFTYSILLAFLLCQTHLRPLCLALSVWIPSLISSPYFVYQTIYKIKRGFKTLFYNQVHFITLRCFLWKRLLIILPPDNNNAIS